MTLRYSMELRNDRLARIEAICGPNPILRIRTGAQPGGLHLADSGVVLATLNLPADWLQAPANGLVQKNGTWEDLAADAAGNCGHFRIYKADGVTPVIEGQVTATGAGGDMTVDNVALAAGQEFRVTAFQIADNMG